MRLVASLVLPSLAFTLVSASALAGQLVHSTTVNGLASGAGATATLPRFDSSLGALRSAQVSVSANVTGTLRFENTTASATSVGGYTSGTFVALTLPWNVPGISGVSYLPSHASFIPEQTSLAAFDGVLDFAGPSAVTHTFSNANSEGDAWSIALSSDAHLSFVAGTGDFSVALGAAFLHAPGVPPGVSAEVAVTGGALVQVRYEFDPFPTTICRATESSGCPCANSSVLNGGCGNSVNGNGGTLGAFGSTSLSNDTFTLGGTGMTNSNALYFQGTSFQYAQSVYGDGLRCVTGSIVRLASRTNVGGASQVPAASGTPISVLGGVVAPGTRFYQIIYRDNGAFCTASNFNATNGLAVVWAP